MAGAGKKCEEEGAADSCDWLPLPILSPLYCQGLERKVVEEMGVLSVETD